MDNTKDMILRQLSDTYRRLLSSVPFQGLEEIRFRIERPVTLYYHDRTVYLSDCGITLYPHSAKFIGKSELEDVSSCLLNHSVYAYLNEIKDGFATIRGGHRVGLAGKCIIKNGQITGMTAISGINLRIAREYPGCAKALADRLKTQNGVKNTLLISPPQCGKTTYLRDLARIFSHTYKITIVDERSEIAGTYEGVPQFDIGPQTDVLDRFPKSSGMLLALRSLSPQILLTDELGDEKDAEAIRKLCGAGCRIIASMHGDSLSELRRTKKELLSFFDVAVCMGRQNGIPSVISIESLR
ncbi:MAG: stage III sporulation protein AA [Clostridia bacterium]|nr:stage III sporulation protein AA [Clostridia bacterium]